MWRPQSAFSGVHNLWNVMCWSRSSELRLVSLPSTCATFFSLIFTVWPPSVNSCSLPTPTLLRFRASGVFYSPNSILLIPPPMSTTTVADKLIRPLKWPITGSPSNRWSDTLNRIAGPWNTRGRKTWKHLDRPFPPKSIEQVRRKRQDIIFYSPHVLNLFNQLDRFL